jgi:hypothetical protein
MFGLEWGLALTGIIIKSFLPNKFEKGVNIFFIVSYIIMGWMLLFFIIPIFKEFPVPAIILIFTGGLLYTFGTFFFKMEKIPYHHLFWHLFVLGGSMLHFIAIFRFLIPLGRIISKIFLLVLFFSLVFLYLINKIIKKKGRIRRSSTGFRMKLCREKRL